MRACEERTFRTHDGVELFYRFWPAANGRATRAIVLFHRGHEHSGRQEHIVNELQLEDYAMFAWDARGHGRSPGARGDSPSFAASVKDVDTFIRHIEAHHGIEASNIAIVAQSVGAVVVAAWAHDYAPKVRCLVLASPAFKVRLYFPFARTVLKALYSAAGNFFVNSYVKAKFLTHDPERIRTYESDPLVTRAISVRILLALYETGERLVADAQAIRIPVQMLVSGADWVVHEGPQRQFFERLGTTEKEWHSFPGFYHDTLGERDRAQPIGCARKFIESAFARPLREDSLLDMDKAGYTYDEAASLARPLPAASLAGLRFALARLSMKTLGLLSAGIRLGLRTGFDSGSTLDYVYRNRPSGTTPLGWLIDRQFLASLGWRGIRVRKRHLERAIGVAAGQLCLKGRTLRVLDIAAGHGRYVLDAVAKLKTRPESIELRDYSDINVAFGTALIEKRGLRDIASFSRGDAFDAESIAAVSPRPSLAIISGLYELFPENRLVQASLHGLAQAVERGGCLIYTGQPWHPQLELIARTLTSHRDGRPWIMRRRTQAELDQLVAHAGFRKLEQWTDEWGIFTVSLAERV